MNDEISVFARQVGAWLESEGVDTSIALSTRIRLARNVEGYHFVSRLEATQAEELAALLGEHLLASGVAENLSLLNLEDLAEIERLLLAERHLITRELAFADRPRSVVYGDGERISAMINEEDHLRLQVFRCGFAIDDCWRAIEGLDRKLEREISFAFSEKLGYLTACPTNVGTGMRVSVMLHLPALKMVPDEIKRVFNAATKTNLAIRGIHGEGTGDVGNLYQISNQITLGRSEFQILEDLGHFVPAIINFERQVREALIEERRGQLKHRLEHSLEVLLEAKSLATEATLGLLSDIRLGRDLGLLGGIPAHAINRLMVLTQPGHIQVRAGHPLEPEERDVARAELVREELAS